MSRRQRIIVVAGLSFLLGLPLALIGSLFVLGNVDSGRRLIEHTVGRLSSGRVRLDGLAGRFPDHLQLAHLEVRDLQGPWLQADAIELDSSPLALIHREARVDLLHAARLSILRAPDYGPSKSTKSSSNELWFHALRVDRLDVERLELGAPLVGDAVALRLQGNARAYSLQQAFALLSAQRLDTVPSTYQLRAQIDAMQVQVQVDLEEGAGGPLTHLAGVPDLGALALHLNLAGPREAVATSVDLRAGAMTAAANGVLNLSSGAAQLKVDLESGAMAPRPELSWQRLSLHGTWSGPLSAPVTSATLLAVAIQAPDVRAKSVEAQLRGQGDTLLLDGKVGGLNLATPTLVIPDSKPLLVHAEARFGDHLRPVDFTIVNSLIDLRGHWNIATIDGSASAVLADIRPFAGMAGLDLQGRGKLAGKFGGVRKTPRLELSADLDVRGGAAPIAPLLRPHAKAECTILFRDDGVEFENTHVDASNARAAVNGAVRGGELNLGWKLSVASLTAVSPQIAGHLAGSGDIKGRWPSFEINADASGQLSAHGSPSGALQLSLHMHDLPEHTNGKLDLHGMLDASPLELSAYAEAASGGGVTARIERGDWKSVHAQGDLHIDAKAEHPLGHVELQIKQLADLDRLIGQPLQGSLAASVIFGAPEGRNAAQVSLDATDVGVPAQQLQQLQLRGEIDAPLTKPVLALQLTALALVTDRHGRLEAQARGPLASLNLHLKTDLEASGEGEGPSDAPVQLDSAATLDLEQSTLRLAALQVAYRKTSLRLLAPSVIAFKDGLMIDQLRLGSDDSELQVAGRLTPTLELRASLSNLTAAPLRALLPSLQVDGRVDAHAELTGTLMTPTGKVEMHALGLRAGSGAARGLPATNIDVSARLAEQTAQIDIHMHAGQGLDLDLSGQAPLNRAAPMDLKANGAFDLSVLNPILEAGGQRASGKAGIDAQVAGTPTAPQARGALTLTAVSLQDYSLGARLTDVNATLNADGEMLTLKQFTAHAGPGTISADGTVKLGDGPWPIDLKVSGRDAQPLASDLLTANVNLDLKLKGDLRGQLMAGGIIDVNRVVINIPNALPPDVATLQVVRAGQKPAPPPKQSAFNIALDCKISAPRAVFVRGRGIDAELGGELHIGGTNSEVDVSGGFELRNGTVNLAGTTLTFTDGRISFNGSGVKKRIDPTLDFSATNNTGGGGSATLHVGGYADAPVITLSSVPEMPQDQILSQLLFGSSVAQLSTLQLAQIGAALATMGGLGGGGGFNPINTVQRKLGLDRLSIGGGGSSGSSGATGSANTLGSAPGAANENNAATIEAGRYISSRVYVGAKQSTAGPTQAQVQVDLTKKLKIQATLGSGGGSVQGATPQNDPGSSAGITYQFEY
jgi:translocation and assembly module TamB